MEAIGIISVVYIMSLIIPVVGFLVDRTGRRDYWITLGCIVVVTAFAAYLSSESIHSIVITIVLGVGYAIFDPVSSASTALVAPPNTEGFANAVLKFLRYFGTGTFALIAGAILDKQVDRFSQEGAWRNLLILLLVLAVLATLASLLMVYANFRSRHRPLTPTEKEHQRGEREKDATHNERTPLLLIS